MKLENIESATIPVTKVRDYLLSQSHSIGRYKAAFFRSLGYEQANWEALANDLRSLLTGDAKQIGTTKYGVKYEIRGSITGPNGRTANVLLDYTDGRGNAKICDRVSRGLAHGH